MGVLEGRLPEAAAARDAASSIRIRATTERPQNKAHVEGAFGLFSQTLPDLVLDTHAGLRALAGSFLSIVVQTWARTVNHRPRADRGGRSRAQLYAEQPSDEQIDNARRALREIAARQERARRTLEARRRPEVLALLDDYFARFEQQGSTRCARRRATFCSAALPKGAMQTCSTPTSTTLAHCVDEALATPSELERTFWLHSLADAIRSRGEEQERKTLLLAAARRIEATFAVSPRERHDAVRVLNDHVIRIA